MKASKEYAIYKGDKLLAIGTAEECAAELNVQPRTIRYYTLDCYKKKLEHRKRPENCRHGICLDDDDE